MKSTKLLIEGSNLESLVELLKGEFDEWHISYPSNNVQVFQTEKFSFWYSTTLMSTIVLDYSTKNRCEVDITTGGAAMYWICFKIKNSRTENKRNDEIIKILNDICDKNYWTSCEIKYPD